MVVPVAGPSGFSPDDKIALFRRLFRGRTDAYPVRWESKSTGKAGALTRFFFARVSRVAGCEKYQISKRTHFAKSPRLDEQMDSPFLRESDLTHPPPRSATVDSHCVLAEHLPSMLGSSDHSRRGVGFPIPC